MLFEICGRVRSRDGGTHSGTHSGVRVGASALAGVRVRWLGCECAGGGAGALAGVRVR